MEASILDDALAAMAERAARVKLGDGLAEDTTMGPLVSAEQLGRVERYLEIGRGEAELVAMIMHARVQSTRLKLDRVGLTIEQGTELDRESIVVARAPDFPRWIMARDVTPTPPRSR